MKLKLYKHSFISLYSGDERLSLIAPRRSATPFNLLLATIISIKFIAIKVATNEVMQIDVIDFKKGVMREDIKTNSYKTPSAINIVAIS